MGGDKCHFFEVTIKYNFNPLRPCGRRLVCLGASDKTRNISIHSARVGGDIGKGYTIPVISNFNPLRPCGRRRNILVRAFSGKEFQSTPPVWAETGKSYHIVPFIHISIHSARVGGDLDSYLKKVAFWISIHSARVGGDETPKVLILRHCLISIHSARVGGDFKRDFQTFCQSIFQSTPPVWAETREQIFNVVLCKFQSTPPVWAET